MQAEDADRLFAHGGAVLVLWAPESYWCPGELEHFVHCTNPEGRSLLRPRGPGLGWGSPGGASFRQSFSPLNC